MSFGGFNPGAETYGGGTPLLKTILEGINRARGTAYNTSRGTAVWAENMAIARAMLVMWNTNRRLVNQFDPLRVSDPFLGRWEKFLGLVRLPSDTDVDRRARVAAHWKRFGQGTTYQHAFDLLSAKLGSVFVGITLIDTAHANIFWPAGTPSTDTPWYSTVAKILVHAQLPAGYSEGDFLNAVAEINPLLDGVMPAWATWDWYRNSPSHIGAGSWSVDTSAGFYLDEGNINYEVFDV